MSGWSKTWPREPGHYWIWVGGHVRLCRVALAGPERDRLLWYGDSRFFYPEESPEAQFMPAEVPDPPLAGG